MANEIKYQDVVATALSEVGYQGETKNSKFTQFLDSINWYNYKKAGACTWCAIFYDYCIAVNKGDLSYEQARQIVCEPANHNDNAGAGCVQKADMYKRAGRWISKAKDATTGDQIFFKNSDGIYHTGIVVGWDDKYIYTVEGSTTYDGKPHSVGKKQYPFSSTKIAGFGRPDWYKYQTDDKPEPTPEPTPTPEPDTMKYKVKTNGGTLSLRNEPKLTQSVVIANIPNGTTLDVMEIVKGEKVNNNDSWAKTNYYGKIGYCTCSWIVPVTEGKQYTVRVNSFLNVRTGPGKNYPSVGKLYNNNTVTVYATSGDWAEIGEGKWVCMDYLV